MSKFGKTECFKIRLYKTDVVDDIFNHSKLVEIHTILCCQSEWSLHPLIIVADPFLFVHQNKLYLFYEKKHLHRPGVIEMISTDDLVHWTTPITVLQEPWHLSYPWVFEEEGKVYMIPESGEDHSVKIYQADNQQLEHFTFKTTILRNIENDYSDSSIFKKDDGYYLMTTVRRNMQNELLLYYSKSRFFGYIEHPASPIAKGNKYGRNAGSLIDNQGKIYRVAQDCVKRYGDNVHLLEVKELTKDSYKEDLVKTNLLDINMPFFKEGGHQFNVVKFRGQYVIALDAKEYHSFIPARVLDLVKNYL